MTLEELAAVLLGDRMESEAQDLIAHGAGAGALVRRLAREHFVQERVQGVDVAARVLRFPGGYRRRHVGRGAFALVSIGVED